MRKKNNSEEDLGQFSMFSMVKQVSNSTEPADEADSVAPLHGFSLLNSGSVPQQLPDEDNSLPVETPYVQAPADSPRASEESPLRNSPEEAPAESFVQDAEEAEEIPYALSHAPVAAEAAPAPEEAVPEEEEACEDTVQEESPAMQEEFPPELFTAPVVSDTVPSVEEAEESDAAAAAPSGERAFAHAGIPAAELPPDEESASPSVGSSFEEPYTAIGKNGKKHIRYALDMKTDRKIKTVNVKKEVLSWVSTILIAVLLALFIRQFVFFIGDVNGPSMQPTFYTGYKLFVTRYDYSFREMQRGDIVIINYDLDAGEKTCVKRLAALPGETIRIENGLIYITGTDGVEFLYEENYTHVPFRTGYSMAPVYVPADCVFVIGDNHQNSADSRMVGPIKTTNILGHVRSILLPTDKFGSVNKD